MSKTQRPVASDKSQTVAELPRACQDETAAVEFFEKQRWGSDPACPRCGSADVYQMKSRTGERAPRYLWRCRDCNGQHTVRVGTVLEDSRIPLRHWAYAFWAACSSKKGVSALQIKRMTGLSYKSALFLMHRIRFAMASDEMAGPLGGTVEADETYVGGKPRYRGEHNKGKCGRGTDKIPVMAMIERGGGVRAAVLPTISSGNLKAALRACVAKEARLITDESNLYQAIGREFPGGHETVNHSRKEYARGDVHVNTCESFFALLKRGLHGTFHSVSPKHLHRYVSEFEYRYTTRKLDDGARTVMAIKRAEGRRLTYRGQLGC
jgi:transposase-like protein